MKTLSLLSAALVSVLPLQQLRAGSALHEFVTVKGDQLMEGNKPFRFISFNIPNLFYVEDNVAFTEENPWRLADRFEITDALETVRQMGGAVVRPYVLSVVRTNDDAGIPRFVLGPGRFNEQAFRTLDEVLQVANEKGVRLILPFVDCWSWWGGAAEYAGFHGKPKEAFWTDPEVIADFKKTVAYVVNRTNALTGVPYREDKAILCWETGNELQSPPEWTREIAAYVKSLDSKHPVMDGFHTTELRPESLAMPEVDIVTTHHYPGGDKSYAELIRANWEKAKGKKPYVVGEFGFMDTPYMEQTLEAVQQTGASGALVWSLRPRNRDGGFYWHSEPAGGNKYKAYHWPGFGSGKDYDEVNLMALIQRKACQIRGLPMPKPRRPASPKLLPIPDVGSISWQGSVGATTYLVERAAQTNGPWTVVRADVDETAVQYRPLFADTKVTPGSWFYRVCARNETGISAPSNVIGPVGVRERVLVDEMEDFSLINERQGTLELKTRDCRKAKEDAHRIAGQAGSSLTYVLPGPVRTCRLYAFFPGDVVDFRFLVSADGKTCSTVPSEKKVYYHGAGDYGYWKPVVYECKVTDPTAHFLKVEFAGEAELGRLELTYGD